MLSNANLPIKLWAKVTQTAVHLINRCTSTAVDFKTLVKIWSGKPADYSNLRIFGNTGFVHVNEEKLQLRAIRCIFLDYPDSVKGYGLWNPMTRKTIISRDAVFKEFEMFGLSRDLSGGSNDIEIQL